MQIWDFFTIKLILKYLYPCWKRHEIYFNGREPCPTSADYLQPDGSCPSDFCCRKTQLQAAKWNFQVRGKCWVLKNKVTYNTTQYHSFNSTHQLVVTTIREAPEEVERKLRLEKWRQLCTRIAVGIIATTAFLVLAFRKISAKLDECKRKATSLEYSFTSLSNWYRVKIMC